MRASRAVLAPLAVAGLLLGACGGDDDTGTVAPETSDVADDGRDDNGDDGTDLPAGTPDRECLEAALAMSKAAASVSGASSGRADDLEASIAALEQYANAAPQEIRAEMRVLAEGYGEFARILVAGGYDPETIQEASERLDDAEFEAASERVDEYFASKCRE